jgi:DNA ligase-1
MVPGTFQDVSSGIMSEDGFPDFYYNLFDWASDRPYDQRISEYENLCYSLRHSKIKAIETRTINSKDELLAYEQKVLSLGYEGVMVRTPKGPYKQGRSTVKEQYLLKVKRFKDSEAVIIGFVEGQTNNNLAKKNEVGHTKRSTCKEGMMASNTLGAFSVRDLNTNVEFEIGTGKGLTQELKQAIWNDQKSYLNKIVKYKFFEIGTLDLPRFPSFQGFRDPDDL